MKSLLYPTMISLSLCSTSLGWASEQLKEEGNSSDSLRVQEQKQAGILEENREYSDKSDFVKNRDRVEGTLEQTGKVLENAGKNIGETVKKLF